ncbi:MAG: hypothetical protein PHG66_02020 [Candidatus Colwellbacteria bacterium]|nr:hypothetical protein [Candidatus Colwellbacteria bacterium]
MTIETIKGVVGVKIGMFDLIRLFMKYSPTGELIKSVKKTCNASDEKPLEEILNMMEDDAESDEWSDIVADIGSDIQWTPQSHQWVPHTLRIENTDQDYHFELSVYRMSHDRDEKCDFILGEEIMSINTRNTHFGSLAQGDDDKRLEQVQTMMISFMKSTVDHDKMMDRKKEMDTTFTELKDKKMGYHLVQNDCDCCS